jgi:hypothetical protein
MSAGMGLGLSDMGHALLFWERRVLVGRRQGRRLGAPRYREVRYEDLIMNPESVLRALSRFLELDYQADMLEYHARAEEVLKGVPSHENHKHLRHAPTIGVRDWRRDLSPSDMELADVLVGSTLERFGYERTHTTLWTHLRADALRLRVEADLRRASKSVKTRMIRFSRMGRSRKAAGGTRRMLRPRPNDPSV